MNLPKQTRVDESSTMTLGLISAESIRARAYEIYVHRGKRDGHAEGDWFTAEAELRELKRTAEAALSVLRK